MTAPTVESRLVVVPLPNDKFMIVVSGVKPDLWSPERRRDMASACGAVAVLALPEQIEVVDVRWLA
jgi:hypothetical protein